MHCFKAAFSKLFSSSLPCLVNAVVLITVLTVQALLSIKVGDELKEVYFICVWI